MVVKLKHLENQEAADRWQYNLQAGEPYACCSASAEPIKVSTHDDFLKYPSSSGKSYEWPYINEMVIVNSSAGED